ncbi:uncharacterized protein LOC134277706 [Saccostrea cucullata]|uniref:uncharacterized protein LOC134277706 n=1 Tax=Saccostrea cuccullata TaxID=36930 RepID=UPI002ED321C5
MDLTFTSPSSFPQTTPRPRTSVRRNLLQDFESELPSPIVANTESPQNRIVNGENCTEAQNESTWYSGITIWISGILALVLTVLGVFRYIPQNLLSRLTHEALGNIGILLLGLIVCAVVWKMCQSTHKRTTRNAGRITSTVRNISTDRAPDQEAGSYNEEGGLPGRGLNIQVKRTFKGEGTEVWSEFVRYFENIAALNNWSIDMRRRVLITTFRGQAEAFAYGLPDNIIGNYNQLKLQMDNRFGHTAMKESYIVEAKMRKKLQTESFRDFGQAIADLYRRAHPGNRDYVEEASLKTFMDNCNHDDDFRLAVKRTRPKSLQEAVTAAMQEECIRMTENRNLRNRENNPVRPIYRVSEFSNQGKVPVTGKTYRANPDMEDKTKPPEIFKFKSAEAVGHVSAQQLVKRPSTGEEQRQDDSSVEMPAVSTQTDVENLHLNYESNEKNQGVIKIKGKPGMRLDGLVEGTSLEWKFDTGAMNTFITEEVYWNILPEHRPVLERAKNSDAEVLRGYIISMEDSVVPAHHESIIKATFDSSVDACDGVLLPLKSFVHNHGLAVARERHKLPEHLEQVFKEASENLTGEQAAKFKNFLLARVDAFADPNKPVERATIGEHRSKLKEEIPLKEPVRRVPIFKREIMDEEIKKLEEQGLIEKSNSPWSAPIVLVQKKDKSWRLCVDYRKLNANTIKDAYPIPRVADDLDSLAGSTWFSSLDLNMAYHQIPMSEEDKEKTARTFDEHLDNLSLVLDRLQSVNLKLKAKKCNFFRREVSFLGHIVSKEGIKTDPSKIEAVKNWKTPSNVTELRSFLGLAAYYRRFIKDFAKTAKCLHILTGKNQEWNWTQECDTAFEFLKQKLISAPILGYPDVNAGDFILDTDASNEAIGAVLSQIQNGREIVISYGSRVLNNSERNYCVTRKEMLAVVYFVQHFKHYLLGREFLLRTRPSGPCVAS